MLPPLKMLYPRIIVAITMFEWAGNDPLIEGESLKNY
jgi:hypothetical protein